MFWHMCKKIIHKINRLSECLIFNQCVEAPSIQGKIQFPAKLSSELSTETVGSFAIACSGQRLQAHSKNHIS